MIRNQNDSFNDQSLEGITSIAMTSQIANKAKQLPPGVYCPVVSLYKDSKKQEVDLDASYKYFAHLVKGGCHGLVLAGSTAEARLVVSSMTPL